MDDVLAIHLVNDSIIKDGFINKCPYCSGIVEYEIHNLAIYRDSSHQKIEKFIKMPIMRCAKCNKYYSKQDDLDRCRIVLNYIKVLSINQTNIKKRNDIKNSAKKVNLVKQVKAVKEECASIVRGCLYCGGEIYADMYCKEHYRYEKAESK